MIQVGWNEDGWKGRRRNSRRRTEGRTPHSEQRPASRRIDGGCMGMHRSRLSAGTRVGAIRGKEEQRRWRWRLHLWRRQRRRCGGCGGVGLLLTRSLHGRVDRGGEERREPQTGRRMRSGWGGQAETGRQISSATGIRRRNEGLTAVAALVGSAEVPQRGALTASLTERQPSDNPRVETPRALVHRSPR